MEANQRLPLSPCHALPTISSMDLLILKCLALYLDFGESEPTVGCIIIVIIVNFIHPSVSPIS